MYVLGVRPVTPGYATWTVAPQLGNLRWAQGAVPTPHGPIAVAWRRAAKGRSRTLTVHASAGTTGSLAVPLLGHSRTIARNGTIVWSHGSAAKQVEARRVADAVVFSQRGGMDTYAWAAVVR
jgi:alpha-L-rhamnosidase